MSQGLTLYRPSVEPARQDLRTDLPLSILVAGMGLGLADISNASPIGYSTRGGMRDGLGD